jgi:sporulation protein YlmC with PRC-barrel domain
MIDDGSAIHYSAVERGTPVYGSDGEPVGEVRQVVDNYREHILDGIVILTDGGKTVFADAPEVGRTAERGVTLTIAAAQARELPPPEDGPGSFKAKPGGGRLSRLLGSGWKRDR